MKFIFPINQQLNCSDTDSVFLQDLNYLLELTGNNLKKISSLDAITVETFSTLGKECDSIILTRISDDQHESLLDEDDYPKLFIGKYSEKFIEAMHLVHVISQLNWGLDTYSTLELWDNGIKLKDKEYFLKTLNLLHNKLLLIEHSIKTTKNREQ